MPNGKKGINIYTIRTTVPANQMASTFAALGNKIMFHFQDIPNGTSAVQSYQNGLGYTPSYPSAIAGDSVLISGLTAEIDIPVLGVANSVDPLLLDPKVQQLQYRTVENHVYNSTLTDIQVTIEGNYFLAITSAPANATGVVEITRGIGNESITFGGTLKENYIFPTQVGVKIRIRYEQTTDGIIWTWLNPFE